MLDTLEGLLRRRPRLLLGDRFSAADVYLGSQIAWGLMFATMEERPGFRAYTDRCCHAPPRSAPTSCDTRDHAEGRLRRAV